MRKNIFSGLFLVFFLAVSMTASGEDAKSPSFSADVITKVGPQTMNGKLYVADKKTRMETTDSIIITRPDKKLSWLVIPVQQMYMEHPMMEGEAFAVSKTLPGEIERKEVGAEEVSGKKTKKFEVVAQQGPEKSTIYQWISDEVPIPVKLEAADGSWSILYQNIQEGAQPDSLFELPADYKKFEMPSGMPTEMPTEPQAP